MIEGKELGEAVLKLVTEHPEQHDSSAWVKTGAVRPVDSCGTTACLAGWAVILNAERGESPLDALYRIAGEARIVPDWEEVGVRLLSGRPIRIDQHSLLPVYDDQQDEIKNAFYTGGDDELAVELLTRALDMDPDA